jgi:hypothetical protein
MVALAATTCKRHNRRKPAPQSHRSSPPLWVIFTGAMLALFFGLAGFLREIYPATRSLRIGLH